MSVKGESPVMNGQSMYPCVECGQFTLRPKKKYTDIFLRTSWMKYCEPCAQSTRGKWISKHYEVKRHVNETKKRKRMETMIEHCTMMTMNIDVQIKTLEQSIEHLKILKANLEKECDETKHVLDSN